jgi:uncharacterized protein YqgC (DUF456 family)
MKRHSNSKRGNMGAAILAILGIFLALHLIFPGFTLWPFALISLAVVTMIVSHARRNRQESQRACGDGVTRSR